MPQAMIRVQIHETVTHTFLMEAPTDDDAAIKDAAENVFLYTNQKDLFELTEYQLEVTERSVHVEPAG